MTLSEHRAKCGNEVRARGGRWRTIASAVLLATAFVATHVPPPERPYPHMPSDKLLHVIGFTVLGVTSIWRLAARGNRITARRALAWWVFLAAYGLFDETTQPIMRRTFEWADWFADCGGAVLGIVGAACWYRICPRKAEECRP